MATAQFEGLTSRPADVQADMLFIPVFTGDDSLDDAGGLDAATAGEVQRARASREFRGRLYEFFITSIIDRGDGGAGWKAKRVALVGAGSRNEATPERLRRIAAACGYTARLRSVPSIAFVVRAGLDVAMAVSTAADGLSAPEFEGASYKTSGGNDGRFPERLAIVAPGADAALVTEAVRRGRVIGTAANHARVLANEPGNVLTPRVFADRVSALASRAGLSVEVFDEQWMREKGMGLLLGVAQGSAEPPRLAVIRYEPEGAPASPLLGFVGKGVTFDSGGISIKPADGMDRMKDDMAGGAAVAAALQALPALGGRYRAIGVIPMTENMPGGRATRPGDVLTGASGKTVEIINTDAEGRLILADALWYAQQLGATHLVDVATLTGAIVAALGKTASGLFGTTAAWVDTVRGAGDRGGDRLWPLPLYEEYSDLLKSEIADFTNSGGRPAGASSAAWFLREFVDDRPWAHLDIAGTAWEEERKAYQPKGATGVAVRTLIELAMTGGRPAAPAAE